MAENNGLPRVFVVRADIKKYLTLRDWIAASEASGVDVTDLGNLRGVARVKGLAGLAWVRARRDEPDLTYDEVLDWRIDSEEEAPPLVTASDS